MDKKELSSFLNNFILWFPGTHFRRDWVKGIPEAERTFNDLDRIIAQEGFDLAEFNRLYARYQDVNQQFTDYQMKI